MKTKVKAEYFQLLENGYNQKEASAKLGVSENSASKWSQELKMNFAKLKTIKQNIIKRLELETANPATPTNEIHNLTSALSVIDKQINSTFAG